MNKKSLDAHVQGENFNRRLFQQAISMITHSQKVPAPTHGTSSHLLPAYKQLEETYGEVMRLVGRFVQAEKLEVGGELEHSVDVFEESKVLVETTIKRVKEESNTIKKLKNNTQAKQPRPQDKYNIPVGRQFDRHIHHDYLHKGLYPKLTLCNSVQASQPMSSDVTYISTQEQLHNCINQIKGENELAVDVEHSQKTYEGITCLIQLSTRHKDYIVDVLAIWKHVHQLKEVMENPDVLKVMHGADMDTVWLQRDYNIHIVNLFDTHKAARYLGKTNFSYGYLLQHYCAVTTDKKYQRADWTLRPLTPEMLLYARMDTHYLLQIYDHIRQQLSKQANELKLNLEDIFKSLQKSSHEVTLIEVELFSYKSKEVYKKLSHEVKPKFFKLIDKFFWILNQAAYHHNESFITLVPGRILNDCLSVIKDLLYNEKSKVSKRVRIERVCGILMKSQSQFMVDVVPVVKEELQNYFLKQQKTDSPQQIAQPARKQSIRQPLVGKKYIEQNEEQFVREMSQVSFNEYKQNSFETVRYQPLNLQPITNFLSQKYNIHVVEDKPSHILCQSNEPEQEQYQQKKEQEEDGGMIEFKRMKPNVIYTIEEQEDLPKEIKPRKKRKQLEYEARLKSKTGNIYDLLQDNN